MPAPTATVSPVHPTRCLQAMTGASVDSCYGRACNWTAIISTFSTPLLTLSLPVGSDGHVPQLQDLLLRQQRPAGVLPADHWDCDSRFDPRTKGHMQAC